MNQTNKLRIKAIFAVILASSFAHSETVKLNLNKGDRHLMHTSVNVSTSIESAEKSVGILMGIATDNLFQIKETSRQGYAMDVSVERVKMHANMPQRDKSTANIDIDTDAVSYSDSLSTSTDKEGLMKQMGIMLKLMTGKCFALNVASNGKVLNSGYMEAVMQPALAYLNRHLLQTKLPADSIEKIKMVQKQTIKQANLTSGFDKSFIIFPDKPVNVGDTWQTSAPMNGDTVRKMIITNRLLDITPDEYLVESISSLPPVPSSGGFLMSLFKIDLGENKAIYHLDRETGWVKSAEGSMLMTMLVGDLSQNKKGDQKQSNEQNKGVKIVIRTNYAVTGGN